MESEKTFHFDRNPNVSIRKSTATAKRPTNVGVINKCTGEITDIWEQIKT